jgi:hypothetical protein
MSTNHHTPHSTGFDLTASNFNTPLGQLDAAISQVLNSGTSFPGAPSEGDQFFKTDENLIYFYLDSDWRPIHWTKNLQIIIDGGGSAITSGEKYIGVRIPWNCTILAWYLVADQSGSIQIDLQVDTFANFPPTVADTIVASAPPALSTAQTDSDSTLSGWTTALAEGDWMRVYVDSATTVEWVNLVIVVALDDGA